MGGGVQEWFKKVTNIIHMVPEVYSFTPDGASDGCAVQSTIAAASCLYSFWQGHSNFIRISNFDFLCGEFLLLLVSKKRKGK